jgi:hypothetical protein
MRFENNEVKMSAKRKRRATMPKRKFPASILVRKLKLGFNWKNLEEVVANVDNNETDNNLIELQFSEPVKLFWLCLSVKILCCFHLLCRLEYKKMIIENISIYNLRWHRQRFFEFSDSINVIYGNNGVGKTTILDSNLYWIDFKEFPSCK